MKRIFILLIAVLILLVISFFQNLNRQSFVIVKEVLFRAEFAETPLTKEVGLSKYNNIDNDFALVFLFEKSGKPVFWMKNMLFPIDIIFVKDYKITQIYSEVPKPANESGDLPLYIPKKDSDIVIEINSGLSKKYKFKEGDQIKIVK